MQRRTSYWAGAAGAVLLVASLACGQDPDPQPTETCEPEACGPLPGDFPTSCGAAHVPPTPTCVSDGASCSWVATGCEPQGCAPDACGPLPPGPPPTLCPDGSLVGPSMDCAPDDVGICGWQIGDTPACPAESCAPDACGPPPPVAPLTCPDGSVVGPTITCGPSDAHTPPVTCVWNIEPVPCPDTCAPDACGPPPPVVPITCDDGSQVGPDMTCVPNDAASPSEPSCVWDITYPSGCVNEAP